jgi:hypothetical protein
VVQPDQTLLRRLFEHETSPGTAVRRHARLVKVEANSMKDQMRS